MNATLPGLAGFALAAHLNAAENAAYLPELERECERSGLALQLTDDPAVDLPEFKVINGRRTVIARSDELGIALDEVRLTRQAAAAYVANKVHDQALTTDNPAETLDDILSTLDDSMPEAFATMGTAPGLAAVLKPEVTRRLVAFRDIEQARVTDTCGFGYVLDILTASIRDGAEPGAVFDRSLELFEQARAEAGR